MSGINTSDVVNTIETFAGDTRKTITQQIEKTKTTIESVSAFGQETMDAVVKAQSIAARAAEEMQTELVAFSKKSVEEGVAHVKDLAASRTVSDFVEKQAGYAKAAVDGMVRQSVRLNEMAMAAMKDAMAPLGARAAAAAETMKPFNV